MSTINGDFINFSEGEASDNNGVAGDGDRRKRHRFDESIFSDDYDDKEMITRLIVEKRLAKQALEESEARVKNMQQRIDDLLDDMEVADERVGRLEMSLIDLQESNSKYAVLLQDYLNQIARADVSLKRLSKDMIAIVSAHHRKIQILLNEREALLKRTQAAEDNGGNAAVCLICAGDASEYVVFSCKHAVCDRCSQKIEDCPVCRSRITCRVPVIKWW